MDNKNLSTQVLIGGAMLSCILPVLIFKFAYLDNKKKLQEVKGELETINQNMAVMDSVLTQPGIITNYITEVAMKQKVLEVLLPSTTAMTGAQKVIARIAKEQNVTIVALRPLEESVPFMAEEEEDQEGGHEHEHEKLLTAKSKPDLGIMTGLIELNLRGTYPNIVSCFQTFESTTDVTIAVERMELQSNENSEGRLIDADIQLRLFYLPENRS